MTGRRMPSQRPVRMGRAGSHQQPRAMARHNVLTSAALLLVLIIGACDTDVTLVTGTEQAYSLYGVLSPDFDTQWVRVYPIDGTLQQHHPEPLNVRFVSTDLQTGEEVVWRDSIIEDTQGGYGHLFWRPGSVEYGHTYLIEAEDLGEEKTTHVRVDVPPYVVQVVQPSAASLSIGFRAEVEGAPGVLESHLAVEVKYVHDVPLPLQRVYRHTDTLDVIDDWEQDDDAWKLHVRRSVLLEPLGPNVGEVLFVRANLRTAITTADWVPPGGAFDVEGLVEPGTFTNVENGLGFVGAGYWTEVTWVPGDTLLEVER